MKNLNGARILEVIVFLSQAKAHFSRLNLGLSLFWQRCPPKNSLLMKTKFLFLRGIQIIRDSFPDEKSGESFSSHLQPFGHLTEIFQQFLSRFLWFIVFCWFFRPMESSTSWSLSCNPRQTFPLYSDKILESSVIQKPKFRFYWKVLQPPQDDE